MSKFKAGDIAFSFADGFGEVEVHGSDMIFHKGRFYTLEGRFGEDDKHPSLLTVEEAAKLGYFPERKKNYFNHHFSKYFNQI